MFKTPGGSISVALKKLLPGGRGQVRLYTSLQQREQAVWRTSKIRYWVKKFSILCMGRCTPLGPQLLSKHHEGGQHLLDPVLRALIYTWRPQITDGCYILIYREGRRYSISHCPPTYESMLTDPASVTSLHCPNFLAGIILSFGLAYLSLCDSFTLTLLFIRYTQ